MHRPRASRPGPHLGEALRRLLEQQDRPAGYADATTIAQAFVKAAPERLVWGSDWPHPSVRAQQAGRRGAVRPAREWAPDEATRNRILVQNPETLYGFTKTA